MNPLEKLERARRELSRAEAEEESAKRELARSRARLREILGCAEGGEKAALAKLERELAEGEAEVERLLSEAEASARGVGASKTG